MKTLLDLSLDVLGLIIREHVRGKRDLRALCRVCKSLRTIAVPCLYNTVSLVVTDLVVDPLAIKCFLDPKNTGVQFTKHLRIISPPSVNINHQLYNIDWFCAEQQKRKLELVNALVLLLLKKIRNNHLQSFEWGVPATMTEDLLRVLQKSHPNVQKIVWKREFLYSEYLDALDPLRLPSLTQLAMTNVSAIDQMVHIRYWIASLPTLRKLDISLKWGTLKDAIGGMESPENIPDSPITCFFGMIMNGALEDARNEKAIAENAAAGSTDQLVVLRIDRAAEDTKIEDEDEEMRDETEHRAIDHRLQLKTLRLGNFPFLDTAHLLSTAINLANLSSLTLRGCPQTYKFLDCWRNSLLDQINLTKLHLLLLPPDSEVNPDGIPVSTTQIMTSVNQFIGAFKGLRDLYLLSNVHRKHPFTDIAHHMDTLERLVLDLKTTSKAKMYVKHERLQHIFENYPNLKELGINISFVGEISPLLGQLGEKLTTLQIRNIRKDEDCKTRREDAEKIATGCFNYTSEGKLRILSMAAAADINFSYTKDILPSSVNIPDGYIDRSRILSCRTNGFTKMDTRGWEELADVFYVQKAVNILGKNVPIVTRIGASLARELEGEYSKILKVQW